MLDEQACATTHRPGTAFSRNRHAPERKALDAKACPKPEPRRFAPTAVAQRHTLRERRLNPMRYATGRWISDRESGRRKTAATASATSHIEYVATSRQRVGSRLQEAPHLGGDRPPHIGVAVRSEEGRIVLMDLLAEAFRPNHSRAIDEPRLIDRVGGLGQGDQHEIVPMGDPSAFASLRAAWAKHVQRARGRPRLVLKAVGPDALRIKEGAHMFEAFRHEMRLMLAGVHFYPNTDKCWNVSGVGICTSPLRNIKHKSQSQLSSVVPRKLPNT